MVDDGPGGFVQQTVFAAAWHDVDLAGAHHIVECVGVHAGSVDDDFCLNVTLIGRQAKTVVDFGDCQDLCVEQKLDAVDSCIFCQCNIEPKRTDDAAGGTVDGTDCFV